MGFGLRKPINLESTRKSLDTLPYTIAYGYRWIKDKDNVQPSQFINHTLFSNPLSPQGFLNVIFYHNVRAHATNPHNNSIESYALFLQRYIAFVCKVIPDSFKRHHPHYCVSDSEWHL